MGQLVPLRFRPGINRDMTRHGGEGGWFDGDKVRFRGGMPEVIGGWARYANNTFLGNCRTIYPWVTLDNETLLGLGTNLKYYVMQGGSLNDITPIRATTTAGDVTFAASNGSSVITVTDTAHGATLDDFVTFSGASGLGGTVTAGVLNAEHQVASVIDANNYTIVVSVVANASDTGDGGAAVVGTYQVNAGANTALLGTGWGSDPWGSGGWGSPGVTSAGIGSLRFWSHDNFGEDLVINARDSGIYYWDYSAGLTARAVALEDLAGANDAPVVASRVMVSDQDRHVICFGCDPQSTPGVQDPLTIRWSDQEDITEWAPTTTTTAGEIRLSSGSRIVTALQTKREIVVFTDSSMHSMQYIGAPFIFGLADIARDVQIVGPEAVIAANDVIFWMARGKFMQYDGVTRTVACPVEDYVFGDFNRDQAQKVIAGHNAEFAEIWWFYPSSNSVENDRYVAYSYEENLWHYGTMARTAWVSAGVLDYPLAAATDGYLYQHEFGMNDGSVNPAVGISAYIESNAVDIDTGSKFFFARRALPDITFRASTGTPSATFTFKAYRFPGSGARDSDAEDVNLMQLASVGVEQYTEQVHIRLRGRAMSLRVESSQENTSWRLGVPRIDIRTDGQR